MEYNSCLLYTSHETRAMLDGQIHDIGRVAKTIKEVKDELEKQTGQREDNEEFINLIDTYSKGRNDSAVRQMVEDIYLSLIHI